MDETLQASSGLKQKWRRFLKYIVENKWVVFNLAAVFLGVIGGLIAKCFDLTKAEGYMALPGEFLMRTLELAVAPVIVTSLFTGVAGFSSIITRKLTVRVGVYVVCTTLVSVATGLILVLVIQPGGDALSGIGYNLEGDGGLAMVDDLMDLLRNMVPRNLLQACFMQYQTKRQEFVVLIAGSNSTKNYTDVVLVGGFVKGVNTVGLIMVSVVFGLALNNMGERASMLVELVVIIKRIVQSAASLVLWICPFAIFCMTIELVVHLHDWQMTLKLVKFMGAVMTGLLIHGAVVLPLIYLVFARRNPVSIIRGVSPALLMAALTSSSSSTLPVTLCCCVERLKMDHRIANSMLPASSEVFFVGTALYETMAAVFITQLNDTPLKLSKLITIGVTAAVASTGAAGIPASGAMITMFILAAVGLSAKEAAFLVVVEWLLDRCNTVLNVWANCIGLSLINELSQKHLEELDLEQLESTRAREADVHQEEMTTVYTTEDDSVRCATSHV